MLFWEEVTGTKYSCKEVISIFLAFIYILPLLPCLFVCPLTHPSAKYLMCAHYQPGYRPHGTVPSHHPQERQRSCYNVCGGGCSKDLSEMLWVQAGEQCPPPERQGGLPRCHERPMVLWGWELVREP